jgi:hypothetical protein
LAGKRRNAGKPALRDVLGIVILGVVEILLDIGRRPDGMEGTVKAQPRVDLAGEVGGCATIASSVARTNASPCAWLPVRARA